eukprot:scaffold19194_cov69-Phaeocystis_antarctica.AAC.2
MTVRSPCEVSAAKRAIRNVCTRLSFHGFDVPRVVRSARRVFFTESGDSVSEITFEDTSRNSYGFTLLYSLRTQSSTRRDTSDHTDRLDVPPRTTTHNRPHTVCAWLAHGWVRESYVLHECTDASPPVSRRY